ncbi:MULTISPECIES: tRNA (guanosine(37)-N1)-methyltransferase TrmD [Spongiibacter]|jgi:tRNA (guanine37-N1)-methyltransferase|uniref:tRNA (guanosine(37)-N1)-methyltransferase TrmD n=1 Tax=Spongiibacter TaxID=630749 RepID=UPI0003B65740|nr:MULTISPECIES: tRNA (guanosine(37)-N1)-methyltransferase TrmD [Spongiibacter]MBO6752480.1 tRNA (guanosine(37)-N1)-methyltransferase TrmD [Spongiibacter sp.]MBU71740.1 tRNA (guanosine(37)-N1)-methyltransferase TrmD [Spongiibacter sp.]|tara:strand:+ start:78942 stop:79682 length:741 start_codon:yes stop_codon:yes gene_type:complete
MDIAVVTLFPEMFAAISEYGVSGRAVQKGAMTLSCINPRDFTHDRHQTVDDRPFGGGPGMVMKVEPLSAALNAAREKLGKPAKTIYLSPQGRPLDQAALATLAGDEALIFLAGRYEGVDERLIEREIDEEWSIGDYVISGGELAAMVMIDGISRLLPGVLGHEQSAEQDSFAEGLLDCPHYTRPEVWGEDTVPEVLRSGNHGAIRRWRHKQALGRTYLRRPDLLDTRELSDEEQTLLAEYLRERDD